MMNNIEQLLERYFEGYTSTEEERQLRRFFTSGDIPKNLMMYKPLFVYFENESKKEKTITEERSNIRTEESDLSVTDKRNASPGNRRNLILWLSGAAACAALLIGVFFFTPQQQKCPGSGNYVIIDGRCYTDTETIHSAVLKSLREMSDDDIDEAHGNTTDIIKNQLGEFDSLFNEK